MKPNEPMNGEIFEPEEQVRFYLFEHALKSEREVFDVPAGLSITEAISYVGKQHHRFAFYLQDGTRIPEDMWDHVRLKPSTAVVARPIAEGPIFAAIGAIISAVSAASAFFTSLGFFGKLLLTGLTIGAQMLLSKLFAPKPPPVPDKSDAKPVYSLSSSRNQLAQWMPIPLLLGRHRITPPLAASPYTETVGDEQYLRQLFCNGYGPLDLEETTAKIGESAVSEFGEAEIEHRYGLAINEPVTELYPASVIDKPLSIELKYWKPKMDPNDEDEELVRSDFTKETCATDTVTLALDFMWPQGLCNIDREGDRKHRTAIIKIQYRAEGTTGSWLNIPSLSLELRTQKTVRRTVTFKFPTPGQYDIQVRKETEDPNPDKGHWVRIDQCQWTAIRSFRSGRAVTFSDAPISLTALKVKASGRINQSIDTYNIIANSMVTAWDPVSKTWKANTASRRPPDLFRWVLQCGANRRPFPTSKIDLVALQNWHAYCVAQGWYYDKWVLNQMSVYDLLIEICAAGRAMPVFKDGKWSVVWDEQNIPVTQLFTPRNSWNFEEQRSLDPIPHGYRVRFANETKGWREDERVVYNDGYDKTNATLLEGFDTPGQTHTNRVYKHGRFHLAQRILRPGTYTLMTSWDALPLIRGDRVRVNYDTFWYGLYSGRVVAVDTTRQEVAIDTNVTLAGATNYMFRFRLANGTFLERTIDPAYVGEYTVIGLVGTAPLPAVGDLFSLGYSGSDSKVLRVVGIEPMDDLVHRLTLVADAPEIADADTGQIPDYKDGITTPIDVYKMPPKNLRVTDGVYADGAAQYWANLFVTWEGPPYGKVTNFQIQYREEDDLHDVWLSAASVGPTVTSYEIRRLEGGDYSIRIRCIFDDGKYSAWVYAPVKATTEFSTPPPDITNFRISTMGDMSVLRWDEVLGVGIVYEIRYASGNTTAPSWNSALPMVTALTNTAQLGTRIGTFFIKAKKPWGLTSANAKSIYTNVASLTALNFVEEIKEEPAFAGTHVGTQIADYELRLIRDITNTHFNTEGIYYFAQRIDLGERINSRLSIMIDAYGFNPQEAMSNWVTLASVKPLDPTEKSIWSVQPEYRITTVNPTLNQWGPWQTVTLTDVLAWAIEFRVVLTGREEIDTETDIVHAIASPSVQQLWVTVDMADRIEKGEDLTAPAAGMVVTFPRGRYREIPAVVVTPQDMAQGDYYLIDQKSTSSFRVRFFTELNAAKSLKFDWMSKGWGLVQ